MARFAFGLVGLAVLCALWAVVLWFLVRPDLSALSPAGLLALHGGPPVVLWLAGWLAIRGVRRRREARMQAAEDAERHEQQRAAEASRQRQRDELARRRTALPVLAAVVASVAERAVADALVPASDAVVVLPADGEDPGPSDDSDAVSMMADVERALRETLSVCPAAAAFPVRVVCPADPWGESVIELARTLLRRHWGYASGDEALTGGVGYPEICVSRLASGEHPVDTVFAAFDDNPVLPGMIVLAIDSPRVRGQGREVEAFARSADVLEHRRWHGDPAQAVVCLVVGNSRLGAMLATLDADALRSAEGRSVMQPYWEAGHAVPAHLEALAALDPEVLAALAETMPVGCLHRAEGASYEERPGRVAALSAAVRRILERGMVNAGMLPLPGLDLDGAPEVDGASANGELQPLPCDWLVHNAGGVDVAGPRLAALSLAMHQLNVDLHPIDEATNFPALAGDLGVALPFAMLVQAVNKACETAAPACWAHFFGAGALRMGVVMPASQPLATSAATPLPSGSPA